MTTTPAWQPVVRIERRKGTKPQVSTAAYVTIASWGVESERIVERDGKAHSLHLVELMGGNSMGARNHSESYCRDGGACERVEIGSAWAVVDTPGRRRSGKTHGGREISRMQIETTVITKARSKVINPGELFDRKTMAARR
jgi:hypothetical protein